VVGLDAPNFGLSGTWRVESLTPDGSLRQWQATLREIDRDVFEDNNPPTDPLTKINIVALASISAPANIIVRAVIETNNDGYISTSVDVNNYDNTGGDSFIYEEAMQQEQTLDVDAQYSLDGGITFIPYTISLNRSTLRTPYLQIGTNVITQMRYVGLNGQTSAWSSPLSITVA
jgi:hypothetical protein